MLTVLIDAQQAQSVQTREGSKNGRDWKITQQSIWLFQKGSKFPVQINLMLPEGETGYSAGEYELDIESAIDQGSFKSIMLDTRKLVLTKKNLATQTPINMGKQVAK